MVWLSKVVNFSTSSGHESLNRLACENKTAPNAAMTKKVINRVIVIAITLLSSSLTKKFTTGCSTIAKIKEKTIGIIMLLAMYIIANKAIKPTKKIVTFT